MPKLPHAVFLMGPTASGKTDLAVQLVERLPLEIISVDSAMVYRGMDIGTAKPGPEVLTRAPHRLLDILDPAEAYSAARFRADALREMAEVTASGKVPLLVGGTMLYFRALQQGLAQMPSADPAVRARLEREAREQGLEVLHTRLAAVDPEAAARIHPHDPQRIQRALEVYEASGVTMSQWRARAAAAPLPYRVTKLVLAPADRAWLRERIAQRFHQMLEQGFLAEVEALYRRGDLNLDSPSMRAVGYRQAWQFLAGGMDFDTMVTRAITATRQLAKRQFTWLRAEKGAQWQESEARSVLNRTLKSIDLN